MITKAKIVETETIINSRNIKIRIDSSEDMAAAALNQDTVPEAIA